MKKIKDVIKEFISGAFLGIAITIFLYVFLLFTGFISINLEWI